MKRLWRRQFDPAIIERTIGLVFGLTALYRSVLKRCKSTEKAVWTILRALSKPPQRRQWSWSPSPLIVSRDSFSIWTWARVQTALSTVYFNGRHKIVSIYFYNTLHVCAPHFYDLSTLVGCWSSVYIRKIFIKFLNVCPFAVSGKVGYPLTGLTTTVGWLLLLRLTVLSRSAIVV